MMEEHTFSMVALSPSICAISSYKEGSSTNFAVGFEQDLDSLIYDIMCDSLSPRDNNFHAISMKVVYCFFGREGMAFLEDGSLNFPRTPSELVSYILHVSFGGILVWM